MGNGFDTEARKLKTTNNKRIYKQKQIYVFNKITCNMIKMLKTEKKGVQLNEIRVSIHFYFVYIMWNKTNWDKI